MEEKQTKKVRIKYTKSEQLKFIGHLDVMRYFQKAVKRAGFDIAYSHGFSPHQLMSFAAPLALGVTSEGEYFDAEFNSLITSDEFVQRFNEQMAAGMEVKDAILLADDAKKAMSLVAGSDYLITLHDSLTDEQKQKILDYTPHLLEKESIEIFRKTKKSEKVEDIKNGIYELHVEEDKIYMFLATGSEYNLKPDSVIEALCKETEIVYNKFDYHIHRVETYMKNENDELVSLLESGTRITQDSL